jgi:UDPglucose 6-dehydrogenase
VSNEQHKGWVARKLKALFSELKGRRVCVWGLTYKAGTNTLRRSSSLELCRWLHREGATVVGHDPAIESLPPELKSVLSLESSPIAAANGADALVVATEWPLYRDLHLAPESVLVVLDPNRFLSAQLSDKSMIRYFTVGKGTA